jgi:hypothetical protein
MRTVRMPLPAASLWGGLAQLRTGSHWLAEETGRWERVPRPQRTCPHCQDGLEDVKHALFVCTHQCVRATMFGPTMHAFLE